MSAVRKIWTFIVKETTKKVVWSIWSLGRTLVRRLSASPWDYCFVSKDAFAGLPIVEPCSKMVGSGAYILLFETI